MAATQLRIDGLRELVTALGQVPDDMQREAAVIVRAHADEAKRKIAAAYPERTGALQRGLVIDAWYDATAAFAIVRSRAKHAWIYEHGTKGKVRQWRNGKTTGVMPAADAFIPIAIQSRRVMVAALVDLVRRAGFDVRGA